MYVIIENNPHNVVVLTKKSVLSAYLGLHRNTITYKFSKKDYFETTKGTVYKANEYYTK